MPRSTTSTRPPMPRVTVRVSIDEDVRNEFDGKFSEYASKGFILENGMREILDMTKEDPTAEEMVRRAIRNHVLRNSLKESRSESISQE